MTEHSEQGATQAGAVPERIGLDDFIEAVTRGVMRALEAQEDVSGYALRQSGADQPRDFREIIKGGTLTWGLIYQPDSRPGLGGPDVSDTKTFGGR